MLTPIGPLTLGGCVPVALTAAAEVTASVGLVMPDLAARLAGLVQLQASLTLTPPSLTADLTSAMDLVTSLQASVAVSLPSIDFKVAAVAGLLQLVQALVSALEAKLDFAANLHGQLSTGGFFGYRYSGAVGNFGQELGNQLAPGLPGGTPSDNCTAWLFIASDASAQLAGEAVFAAA